jgi:hypothetical protein
VGRHVEDPDGRGDGCEQEQPQQRPVHTHLNSNKLLGGPKNQISMSADSFHNM